MVPALITASYLLGSFSLGLLLAKRKGIDLRQIGSGNIGATNAGRALGRRDGRLVLIADALKGSVPTAAALWIYGHDDFVTSATGFAAVFGHCFPIYYRFRGGKGGATAAGVFLVLAPVSGAIAGLVFFALKKWSGRSSIGTICGAMSGAITLWRIYGQHPITWMSFLVCALIVLRHHENIRRLLRGEELSS